MAPASGQESDVYREILTVVGGLNGIIEHLNASPLQLNAASTQMSESALRVGSSSLSALMLSH